MLDYDDEVCFTSVQKIYDYARDPDNRPFFLAASFTHPHNPFTITQEYWDRYTHDEIDLPSVPHIPVDDRQPADAAALLVETRAYDTGELQDNIQEVLKALQKLPTERPVEFKVTPIANQ